MDILNTIGTFLTGVGIVIISFFAGSPVPFPATNTSAVATSGVEATTTVSVQTPSAFGHAYSDQELLSMAGDQYPDGVVPLGDYKYVTDAPKKGYVYLCNVHKDNPGSAVNGPWITGSSWNFKNKAVVDGAVNWKNATFSDVLTGTLRTLAGNDLPISHTTGVFPVAATDDAHQYDANPNTITAQNIKTKLPASPAYATTPYCMGGEAGIMLTGVALFNAFDAGLRDAPAHELQDSCSGHPQGSGEYHYHSLPACLKDTNVSTVIGFAYDGFPITGPVVAPGKYLTTQNLDECHGITSDVMLDGNKTTTYHYVMTYDFPYSVSCFRGKPVTTGPSAGTPPSNGTPATGGSGMGGAGPAQQGGTPPQEALTACAGKTAGTHCSFTGGRGESVSGSCAIPPNSQLVCVPNK